MVFEKIEWKTTYGYKNFISEDTQKIFLDWTSENLETFVFNQFGPNRKNRTIAKEDNIFPLVQNLKKQILEVENKDFHKINLSLRDYIGINFEGAFIQLHADYAEPGITHTRWNLVLSYPEEGGESIYNGEINKLEERLIWKCEASKYMHGSKKVIGKKPRITLSMGFML